MAEPGPDSEREGLVRSLFVGGEAVAGGIYFSLADLGFLTIPRQGGVLPGGAEDRYLKTPTLLVVLVSPLFGITLAVLLPLSGLIVLAIAFWRRARQPSARTPLPDEKASPGAEAQSPPANAKQLPRERTETPPPEATVEEGRGDQPSDDGLTS